MKAVILAGGFGTRLAEETVVRPKPMVEIGGRPVLWHILKIYSSQGINDFVICLGYKGYLIKEFFSNYFLHTSDVSFDIARNQMHVLQKHAEPWTVTLVDTGEATSTAGRLKRAQEYLGDDQSFHFTYGDGLADVDLSSLSHFHSKSGKLVTVTAVQPPGRYGSLSINGVEVTSFVEKPEGDSAWISGGFFMVDSEVLDQIEGDSTSWEDNILPSLAGARQLSAYKHSGFWQPMDTMRDKLALESLWRSGKAPWKLWLG